MGQHIAKPCRCRNMMKVLKECLDFLRQPAPHIIKDASLSEYLSEFGGEHLLKRIEVELNEAEMRLSDLGPSVYLDGLSIPGQHVILTRETCPNRGKPDHDERERCPTCDWRLSQCALCGMAEIELDQPCPGAPIRNEMGSAPFDRGPIVDAGELLLAMAETFEIEGKEDAS